MGAIGEKASAIDSNVDSIAPNPETLATQAGLVSKELSKLLEEKLGTNVD